MNESEARSFVYPPQALRAAYALAASGMVVSFGPLLLTQPAIAFRWLLGTAGALFLVYFARTVVRQRTRIEVDASGIGARGPLGVEIRWDDVRAVRLNYYSTRSDRSGGWMEFIVKGSRRSIRVESTLDGFVELVGAVLREVRARGVEPDERTRANLRAIGLSS
jgi:hypothetical protein